jgi:hypothetical protein
MTAIIFNFALILFSGFKGACLKCRGKNKKISSRVGSMRSSMPNMHISVEDTSKQTEQIKEFGIKRNSNRGDLKFKPTFLEPSTENFTFIKPICSVDKNQLSPLSSFALKSNDSFPLKDKIRLNSLNRPSDLRKISVGAEL